MLSDRLLSRLMGSREAPSIARLRNLRKPEELLRLTQIELLPIAIKPPFVKKKRDLAPPFCC